MKIKMFCGITDQNSEALFSQSYIYLIRLIILLYNEVLFVMLRIAGDHLQSHGK